MLRNAAARRIASLESILAGTPLLFDGARPFSYSAPSSNGDGGFRTHGGSAAGFSPRRALPWPTRVAYALAPPPPAGAASPSAKSALLFTSALYAWCVPSLADRAMSRLGDIEGDPQVLPHDVRALGLRLSELAYEVNQNDALDQATRRHELLLKVNWHEVYCQNLRGLELLVVWADGALWHHAASDTLIATCRGTHRDEASANRDLRDALLLGSQSRVAELQRIVARARGAAATTAATTAGTAGTGSEDSATPTASPPSRFRDSRLVLFAHSLGGAVALRYAFQVDTSAFGVVFNPGEVFLSVPIFGRIFGNFPGGAAAPRPDADVKSDGAGAGAGAGAAAAHNRRFVIVKKPGDRIAAAVRAECLIVEDDHNVADHTLSSFEPTVDTAAAALRAEHERVVAALACWALTVIVAAITLSRSRLFARKSSHATSVQ